jgi:hypothetical protein
MLGALAVVLLISLVNACDQQPIMQIPNADVPQIMTLEGKFVRAAYNNEAYVILGYQIASRTIGDEWIMHAVGLTLMEKIKDYKLTRDDMSLDTSHGHLALLSIAEYRQKESKVQMLQQRMKAQRDSINCLTRQTRPLSSTGMSVPCSISDGFRSVSARYAPGL